MTLYALHVKQLISLLSNEPENYLSIKSPWLESMGLIAFVNLFRFYPTPDELYQFIFSDFLAISQEDLNAMLKHELDCQDSQEILFDATETTYAGYNSGIQRVTRKIYACLADKVRPFQWNLILGTASLNSPQENQALLNFEKIGKGKVFSQRMRFLTPRSELFHKLVFKLLITTFGRTLKNRASAKFKSTVLSILTLANYKFNDKGAKDRTSEVQDLKFLGRTVLMTEYAYLDEKIMERLSVLARFGSMKLIVMLHDCIPISHPEFVGSSTISGWVHLLDACKYASHIITPSISANEEVKRIINVPGLPISTIYLSGEVAQFSSYKSTPEIQQREKGLETKSVIIVGSLDPRKNHARMIQAAIKVNEKIPLKLVLVGAGEWFSDGIHKSIQIAKAKGLTIDLRMGISDETLIDLMKSSEALMLCSLAEGFGLPIAEAGWLNLPVVCSNFGAVAEVAKKFSKPYYADPFSVDSMAQALETALKSPVGSEVPALSSRTWQMVADEMFNICTAISG